MATPEGRRLTQVHRLLDRTTELRRNQARKRREHAADFDFFTSITRWHDETAHSRFLAALLNPRGEHGQGSLFLELFLRQIGVVRSAEFVPAAGFEVTVEHHIPRGSGGVTQDRYADILIQGPDCVVMIENKIRAGEGDGQLPDYGRWLATRGRERQVLVFLTPEGRSPGEMPAADVRETVRFQRMGYAARTEVGGMGPGGPAGSEAAAVDGMRADCPDLETWLAHCLGRVPLLAPVREVIAQYQRLAGRIGGRTVSNEERNEIASLACEDSRMFAAALSVSDAMHAARVELQYRFWNELQEQLQGWFSHVQPKQNSRADIGRYLTPGVSNRPRPGIQMLTDLSWRGHGLCIEIELLPDSDKNWLTIKLLRPLGEDGSRVDPGERRIFNEVERTDLRISHLACPERSFVVGRLALADGSQLDLTNFVPPAHELADAERRRTMVNEVCEAAYAFYEAVAGMTESMAPA